MGLNLMIYPFDEEIIPLLRYTNCLDEYTIKEVLSLEGWGFVGKSLSQFIADKKLKTEVVIKNSKDIKSSLEKSDVILINSPGIDFDCMEFIENHKELLKAKDKVICLHPLEKAYLEKLYSFFDIGQFISYDNKIKINSYSNDNDYLKLAKLNTAVVFVMGMTENTDKFPVQLSLARHFIDLGYKVSNISSRSYAGFWGMHPFPSFMLRNDYREDEKILFFNKFVKEIEEKEDPDLMIIGIPGGFLRINDSLTNRFGVLHFEVSQAVDPDLSIVCNHFDYFNEEYFENMNLLLKHRLESENNLYYIKNSMLDFVNQDIQGDISVINIQDAGLSAYFQSVNLDKFNIFFDLGRLSLETEKVLNSFSEINLI